METTREILYHQNFILSTQELTPAYEAAEKLFRSRKRKQLANAVMRNGKVYVSRKRLACPACGNRMPAYSASLAGGEAYQQKNIAVFLDRQLTFFHQEGISELVFNTPYQEGNTVQCTYCGCVGVIDNTQRSMVIRTEREILKIACRLQSPFEAMQIGWLSRADFQDVSEQFYETLIFDRDSGEVYAVLENGSQVLATAQVLSAQTLGAQDPWLKMFGNRRAFREIKRAFTAWYGDIPYTAGELTFDRLLLLTQFVGYDADFYDALPLCRKATNCLLHAEFEAVGKEIHFAREVPAFLNKTTLPKTKSVKKLLFARPALLFYKNELERLWQVFENVDYFCGLLRCPYIFAILGQVHQYWSIAAFLIKVREKEGLAWLYKTICTVEGGWLFFNAIEYCAAVDSVREKILANIRSAIMRHYYGGRQPEFSLPMRLPEKVQRSTSACGYRFTCLHSTREYAQAATVLNNCLRIYTPYRQGVVFAISKDNYIVAAAEVEDGCVIQALCKNNAPIRAGALAVALETWAQRLGYQFDSDIIKED